MRPIPKITETEWEVMQVIWDTHPITAAEIVERLLTSDPTWHPKTVRTLLARLVQKGALGYDAEGRVYVYTPLITEQQCVAEATDSFLKRVFGGSLKPLLTHFVEQRRISKQELQELRDLLDGKSAALRKPRVK